MTSKQKIDAIVADLATGLEPMVQDIESSAPTTRNHYGRYMAVIAKLAHGDKATANIVALALLQAGGNRQGILDGRQHAV